LFWERAAEAKRKKIDYENGNQEVPAKGRVQEKDNRTFLERVVL
jgi:hypothetical protein